MDYGMLTYLGLLVVVGAACWLFPKEKPNQRKERAVKAEAVASDAMVLSLARIKARNERLQLLEAKRDDI